MRRDLDPPDRPVFIVGPHRSGTTVLYHVLSRHPEMAYLTRWTRRFPSLPAVAETARRLGLDDAPHEAQAVWDRWTRGGDDVRTRADATPAQVARYRRIVRDTVRARGASRFLAKYPRLSFRIGWLEEVFPGAVYVHLARDWRAVVHSTARRHTKRTARGGGWFGVRPPGHRAQLGQCADVASTWQFAETSAELERWAPRLGDRYVRLRYDELCAAPEATVQRLLSHLGLPWHPRVARAVARARLENRNHAWRAAIDEAREGELRRIAPELLARYEDGAADDAVPVHLEVTQSARWISITTGSAS